MRNREASFLGAIAAAAVLLAGTAVSAQEPLPLTTCTTSNETTFTVTSGPSFVPCEGPGVTQCTEIEYQVSPSQYEVFALAGKGVVEVLGGGEPFVAEPCEGIDQFGQGACHQQAIRTYPDEGRRFKIVVAGERRPGPSSVAVNLGDGVFFACEILGIGVENTPNPDQVTQTKEEVDFKGCVVEFTRDARTGEVVEARLTEDSVEGCQSPFLEEGILRPQPVGDLEIKLRDGRSLGRGKFGDGYISTGEESCTTRVIGGKVYTWGKPCP
jgi:hypothetical protein